MNIHDVMRYGHETVLASVRDLPLEAWDVGGVCGTWSVKDIIAHLAAFEHGLVDVVNTLVAPQLQTPYLDEWLSDFDGFNDNRVMVSRSQSALDILKDYNDTYEESAGLMKRVPPEQIVRKGLLSWYGEQYDLEDYVVYTFYGHKREHTAEINAYRTRIGTN